MQKGLSGPLMSIFDSDIRIFGCRLKKSCDLGESRACTSAPFSPVDGPQLVWEGNVNNPLAARYRTNKSKERKVLTLFKMRTSYMIFNLTFNYYISTNGTSLTTSNPNDFISFIACFSDLNDCE